MVTEYGADTVAGLHALPSLQFSKDFQSSSLEEYCKAFDVLREEGIWFMTKQEPRRVAGNRKGLFTRQRQPKAAAHALRRRYLGHS